MVNAITTTTISQICEKYRDQKNKVKGLFGNFFENSSQNFQKHFSDDLQNKNLFGPIWNVVNLFSVFLNILIYSFYL